MSEQNNSEKNDKIGDPAIAKKVTIPMLKKYFDDLEQERGKEVECIICAGTKWIVPTSPEGDDKPIIITLPMPFHGQMGVWAFPISCKKCSNMLLLEASIVTKSLIRDGEI
ncbi:hypothetical protein ABRQ00_10955 [Pectobacterium aroidearum]|uniref:hypothetical protein n=1 Tax=Pectobacterium aroidearum TaxID=1201031 RepID=UPI002FCC6D93